MIEDIIRPRMWIVLKLQNARTKTKRGIVMDYRKINKKTRYERYTMPNITDNFDKLGRFQ